MFHYQIDVSSKVPVYRQLVNQIHAQIQSGVLKNGEQLPTVREMAEKLHLSCGTVKRTYDCLQELGDIEMTRRRGTFVKYSHKDRDSRKIQAMNAIDQMIRKLTELHFSPAEIKIFLNLKMREWGMKWTGIRIGVVTDYLELARSLERQLATIPNVQAHIWPLRQVQEYPYGINEESDLILCQSGTESYVVQYLPDREKCVQVAFAPSFDTIRTLNECTGERIGVLCENEAFFEQIKCNMPASKRKNANRVKREEGQLLAEFDALVCPVDWTEQCDMEMLKILNNFRERNALHIFDYRLDEGSMLYLQERIDKLRDDKQQWPAAMHI